MTPKTISIILILCFYSCTNPSVDNRSLQQIDSPQVPVDAPAIARHFNIDPSKILGEYAVNYKPVATESTPNIDLPKLNDTLKFAIDSLLQTNTSNLKVWTASILAKQFLHHLKCCNQSYEIRNGFGKSGDLDKENNPILYAFLKATNQLEIGNRKNEFLSSGFIQSYLLRDSDLATNNFIKPYFDRIEKIENQAEEQNKLNEAKKKNGY